MAKGGYQIIDFKSKNFTLGTGMFFKGVYSLIEGTTKPIYVTGISIEGVEYRDTYLDLTVNMDSYEGIIYGKKIKISDIDVVTISNITTG